MKTYRFRDGHDISGTINSLRIAAERFDYDVEVVGQTYGQDHPIVRQFRDQAAQARRIASDLEAMEY